MGSGGSPPPLPPGRRSTEPKRDLGPRVSSNVLTVRYRVVPPCGRPVGHSPIKDGPTGLGAARNGSPPRQSRGGGQADRAISTGQLHALLRFHIRPINVVVYHGSQAKPGFEVGFPLRCFQRLSLPHLATQRCGWRHNWYTRGVSIPVLSY